MQLVIIQPWVVYELFETQRGVRRGGRPLAQGELRLHGLASWAPPQSLWGQLVGSGPGWHQVSEEM